MNPKAIIFDLDNTLSQSKTPITTEMGAALKRLLDVMPVAVMSGADFPQFDKQLLPNLPPDTNLKNLYLFPTSAAEALIYENKAWEDAYDFQFSAEEKKKIVSAIERSLEKTGLVEGEPQFGERIEDRGEQITFSALGQDAPLELKEKWDPDHKRRAVLREELRKLIPEFEISIGGTTSIDISRRNVNKQTGVIWLAGSFGVKPGEILYVGDALFAGGNDATVIESGVQTKQVTGPDETLVVINNILENNK